ncbi:MAG: hypothetical protein ABJF04_21200 [Reichenbachiella sp.]
MKTKEENAEVSISKASNKGNKEDQFYIGLTGLALAGLAALLILALY